MPILWASSSGEPQRGQIRSRGLEGGGGGGALRAVGAPGHAVPCTESLETLPAPVLLPVAAFLASVGFPWASALTVCGLAEQRFSVSLRSPLGTIGHGPFPLTFVLFCSP